MVDYFKSETIEIKELIFYLDKLFTGKEEENDNLKLIIKRLENKILDSKLKKKQQMNSEIAPEEKKEEEEKRHVSGDIIDGCRTKGFSFRTSSLSMKTLNRTTPSSTFVSQSFLESNKCIVSYKESTIKIKTPCYMLEEEKKCEKSMKILGKFITKLSKIILKLII